jgi:hypothetical protein
MSWVIDPACGWINSQIPHPGKLQRRIKDRRCSYRNKIRETGEMPVSHSPLDELLRRRMLYPMAPSSDK